jgi:hypothetical protein
LTIEQMDEAESKQLRDEHAARQTDRKPAGR